MRFLAGTDLKIPLPQMLNEAALDPGRLEHILVHEETHRRHGDQLWGLVRGVCLALYWYDPLVWWAAVLSRRDCELACDHSAIRRLGEDRRLDYGQTLVSMIVPGRPLTGLLRTATTMSEGKRTMKERIALIVHRPRMLKVTLAAVAVIVAAVVVLTFGGTGHHYVQGYLRLHILSPHGHVQKQYLLSYHP